MAHRDLGEFYRVTGDSQTALRHYTKSREFSSTSQQILDACLSIIELLIEQRNHVHMPSYIFKAESALEATTVIRPPNASGSGAGTARRDGPEAPIRQQISEKDKERMSALKEKVQTKLELATALSFLGQGSFEKAANTFVKMGPVAGLEDWAEKV